MYTMENNIIDLRKLILENRENFTNIRVTPISQETYNYYCRTLLPSKYLSDNDYTQLKSHDTLVGLVETSDCAIDTVVIDSVKYSYVSISLYNS